jgi:LysM repeat protein
MNNQSPLIPQGSLLEQKNKTRARVKVAVFFVLVVHGIGLFALLMQGCRREDTTTQQQTEGTNMVATPDFQQPTNVVSGDPAVPSGTIGAVNNTPIEPTPAPAPGAAKEYVVLSGDNFTTIGKKFGVTAKAVAEANPAIEATKLKPGQKLSIPAPVPTAPQPTGVATTGGSQDTTGGEPVYTVKSGDNLSKIATGHHTTVRAIRSANNLKTDSIKVGQKLKIPTGAAAAPAVATAVTSGSR